MCMCLDRGAVGGVGVRGLGLGCLVPSVGRWGGVMSECVVCLDYLWRWKVQYSYLFCQGTLDMGLSV